MSNTTEIESFQSAPEGWSLAHSADQYGGQTLTPMPGWLTVRYDDGSLAVVPADLSDGRLVPAAEVDNFIGVVAPSRTGVR